MFVLHVNISFASFLSSLCSFSFYLSFQFFCIYRVVEAETKIKNKTKKKNNFKSFALKLTQQRTRRNNKKLSAVQTNVDSWKNKRKRRRKKEKNSPENKRLNKFRLNTMERKIPSLQICWRFDTVPLCRASQDDSICRHFVVLCFYTILLSQFLCHF